MGIMDLRHPRRRSQSPNTANLIGAWAMDDPAANTTDMIGQWSMDGAAGSLETHFGSVTDAPALATPERARVCGTAYEVPILVKRPEDESWLPLDGPTAEAGDEAAGSDIAQRLIGY
jgi:hypothetical protein